MIRATLQGLGFGGILLLVSGLTLLGGVGCSVNQLANSAASPKGISVADLRCEYRVSPLGIDATAPRLSWVLRSAQRSQSQSAYQVLVASSPAMLEKDAGDLWDSGKVASDQSCQVEYGGKALASGQECFWKVRTWDAAGQVSAWSETAMWSMGLLNAADWKAQWVGLDEGRDAQVRKPYEKAQEGVFIGVEGLTEDVANAAAHTQFTLPEKRQLGKDIPTTVYLRKDFVIPADAKIKQAFLAIYADQVCAAAVNGQEVGKAIRWEQTSAFDVTSRLAPGKNALAFTVSHLDYLPPMVRAKLTIFFENGQSLVVMTDKSWKSSRQAPAAGWQLAGFDDSAWTGIHQTAEDTPWGVPFSDVDLKPAPYLRKTFDVAKPLRRATVYASALGVYEVHLNGERVGKDYLTPGWTDYNKRVHYNTYDVTNQVHQGANAVGAILTDGWYSGCMGPIGRDQCYGANPRVRVQLELEYADGTRQCVATDGSWKATFGPILYADLLQGCEYDSRLDMPGWAKAGFNDAAWKPVAVGRVVPVTETNVTAKLASMVKNNRLELMPRDALSDPAVGLVKTLTVKYALGGAEQVVSVPQYEVLKIEGKEGQKLEILSATWGAPQPTKEPAMTANPCGPVKSYEELPARSVTEARKGAYTFDLGQNFAGFVRLKVKGQPGQRVVVRYGEMLNPNGTLYTANLRRAAATDFFHLRGGEQTLEPYFTFHGFRYVEVTGLDYKPEPSAVTGVVLHSEIGRTGWFECSNPLVNQLFHNIIWGQKSNYLSVPTDCPQRDERAGWTGDAQFFIRTGSYNFDVAAFFTDWLTTLCQDTQRPDGTVGFMSPDMGGGNSVAWSDSSIICPYRIFRVYDDTRIIRSHWEAMERYMAMVARHTKDGVTTIGGFGDWVNLGGGAKAEVIDTAYTAYLASIMSEMAVAIGKADEAKRYADLFEATRESFVRHFVKPDGGILESSQTGYALALTMNLIADPGLRAKMADKLVEDIKGRNWHLATGFIGTPRLLPSLQSVGRDDVAYRLLMQESYPSWLFQVKLGATTMWERWDGWTPERGFQTVTMNSFNHYAFGAVGEFLYSAVGGIDALEPGYKKIQVRPIPGGGLTSAKVRYVSMYGEISSDWKIHGKSIELKVTIPVNTTALVYVPTADAAGVTESGKPATQAAGVKFLRAEKNAALYEVGSGTYSFTATLP